MSGVTYRTVETVTGETGVGAEPRTNLEHQIGATIDGVFVPFLTLSEGIVEVKQRAENDRLAAEAAAKPKTAGAKTG